MDDRAVVEAVQSARGEAEGLDQEVMARFDVLVDEDGDDGGRRGRASSDHFAPSVVRCTPCGAATARNPVLNWRPCSRHPKNWTTLQSLLNASMVGGRSPPARRHHRRAPAHGRRADRTSAGHARRAGAGHGDGRRASADGAGRRLLLARHLLVQHGDKLGAPAPPGPAPRLQCHPSPGGRALRHLCTGGPKSAPSTTRRTASCSKPCSTSTSPR